MAQPADAPPTHCIAVSDELGCIHIVHARDTAWDAHKVVRTWGAPSRSSSILALASSAQDLSPGTSYSVACSRTGGEVDVYFGEAGQVGCRIAGSKDAAAVALEYLHQEEAASSGNLRLLSASGAGCLRIHQFPASVPDGTQAECKEVLSLQTKANVACLATDAPQQRAALGGKGTQLQVWDLSTQQRTFQAKGGKPDMVGLVDPAHVTAVAWLPAGAEGGPQEQVVAGTGEHKLWLYDLRAGRRPRSEVPWGRSPITSLAAEADGTRVWAANSRGDMEALDLRQGRMQGALKGASGSVRALSLHAADPLLASVGLDRHLRLHSAATRKLLAKVYLKQQLTGACFLPTPPLPEGKPAGEEEGQGAGEARRRGEESDEEEEEEEERPRKVFKKRRKGRQ